MQSKIKNILDASNVIKDMDLLKVQLDYLVGKDQAFTKKMKILVLNDVLTEMLLDNFQLLHYTNDGRRVFYKNINGHEVVLLMRFTNILGKLKAITITAYSGGVIDLELPYLKSITLKDIWDDLGEVQVSSAMATIAEQSDFSSANERVNIEVLIYPNERDSIEKAVQLVLGESFKFERSFLYRDAICYVRVYSTVPTMEIICITQEDEETAKILIKELKGIIETASAMSSAASLIYKALRAIRQIANIGK